MRKFFLLALVFLMSASAASAKVYITEPLLVPQSPYAGMTFYVYRPYNMPQGWYVTLDGYPVRKNKDGTWVYGTSEGPNLVATNYVVGSVVPSMAGITKWVNDVQVSELRKLPNMQIEQVQQRSFTRSEMSAGKEYSTYMPDWLFSPSFMAIGNWRGTVDRVGVLNNPAVPAAWNGKSPKVLYLWTGQQWTQISIKESQTPIKAITHDYAKIKKLVRESGFKFYEQDLPILAEQVKKWGYYWLGEINITQ